MPDVVFGDNHLFGINHLSIEKAEQYREEFADRQALKRTFALLRKYGVDDQMMSAHIRAKDVFAVALDEHPRIRIHPVIPYAHAINDQAASQGIVATGLTLLRPSMKDAARLLVELISPQQFIRMPRSSIGRLIDEQLRLFGEIPEANRGVIFIQNVFADLLIGMGMSEWFEEFADLCRTRGFGAGIITYNPQYFLSHRFPGIELCIQYNHVGYLNNIDPEQLVELCDIYPVWAMGVFGSGAYSEPYVIRDLLSQRFSKVVYATSKEERLARFVKEVGSTVTCA